MTPWLHGHLDDAKQLHQAKQYREALKSLLIVLSVYPDSPEASSLAADVIYEGGRKNLPHALTSTELGDPRLDSIFCSCEAGGCGASWVSFGQCWISSAFGQVEISNPSGVRCTGCGGYFCRNHYTVAATFPAQRIQCPRCGGETDAAPRTPNGRSPRQTSRPNHPLVHVYLCVESRKRIGAKYVQSVLTSVAPDALLATDGERVGITSNEFFPWPEDPKQLMMMKLMMDNRDFLSDRYAVYYFPGTGPDSKRFLLAKIYSSVAKYFDPDAVS